MVDSAIAVGVFAGGKAVLATDTAGGLHTLKTTTGTPTDGVAIEGFGATKYVIGTAKSGGLHTICVTTNAPNSAIALRGGGGNKIVLATALSGGVHTLAVTTDAPNSSVLADGFGAILIPLATLQAEGVHTLAVTSTPDSGFTVATFAAGATAIAAAKSGSVYRLALSGLTPPFDPEAAAYFSAAGITDNNAKSAFNDFIVGLKSDFGISSLTDVFDQFVLLANQDVAAAQIDLCGRINSTLVNSPTFTQWRGVKINGITDYIDSNFNPTSTGIRYTQNSKSMGIFLRAFTGNSQNLMGSVNSGFSGTQIWGNDGNGNFAFSDNNGSIYATSPGTPDTGLLVLSRTASNSLKGYSGTTLIGTDTNGAISMLNQNVFVLGRNYNGTLGRTTAGAEAALWFHGRGLNGSEVAALNGRVSTLKVAIGW